jgi:single-strand DNA-binding protein
MSGFNKVILMGNLVTDPIVRQLPSGTSVADLRLAISENYKNKSGENIENVCYVDIIVWARQAETCGQYLSKGSPVFVEGKLQLDEWEKDGQKYSKIRVRAANVRFMGSPSSKTEHKESAPRAATPIANAGQNQADSGDMLDDGEYPF